ncbi:D-glycerate dehydrogenase [Lutimaribacter sp. EGI FJ00015]|uniref:D-glycerate dehydrogenase n=1 Tax=Lutimaribacter degradans TaxID=2945989 RepID=A0ACC5ZX83_9RHOB|nr:D-glycerate dehydrogenase [Lutimaribacter sp. EGI FJ00013]MCM2562946.1 D-glycerate dehydrogenase [Lutimaribacter sp. EGI FJ00013]MCO0614114.1 D-glycerate dehydrogenase [Lutimaribacter sp. EGI FJ00015]MCO0636091.1 D-glycerate dehydrogenase [Lutimaribacter sp. EGI FJ00014]
MSKKKVLLARRLPDAVLARADDLFDLTLRDKTAPMTPSEMRAGLAIYDAIMPTLGDRFSADIFNEFGRPRCKILANFGVGYNHIDIEAARAHAVTVTNTPGAVTDATADIAMTLILMSARRAAEGERLVRSGAWEGWHPTQMLGLHVSGKTVGIVGMGRIGQAIARRCHFGFGMEVLFVNRSQKTVDFPATQVADLAELAARCDVLVAATPGGAETHHLIGADVFNAMKPTAHFVNISRGDVVDEGALVSALQSGRIAGAGLDVYELEPEVPAALRALENVVLLPHLGTAAEEVRIDMGMMVLDNLQAFFNGEAPPNKL